MGGWVFVLMVGKDHDSPILSGKIFDVDAIEPQILIVARTMDSGLRPYDALLQTSIWFATHSTLG